MNKNDASTNHRQRPQKIPVPTNYRSAAKILRSVVEERRNVKTLVLENKHIRKGKGLAIMDLILINLKQIDDLITRTALTQKEPKLNPWLARVLIAELLFGRGELTGESLPVQCVRRYQDALLDALSKSDVTPAKHLDITEPRYVRINTSVLAQPGALRLLQEEGWVLVEKEFEKYTDFLEQVKNLGDSEFIVDFHFKELLVFPNSAKNYWGRATELKQKFVLQNKACLLPTYLLNPPKKSVVLDMCAAPGLKTTHLANLMKNKGRIYAVERNAERYKLLCEFSAEFGVIKTINEDCLLIGDEQTPGVEYILIDPSCSGSGMVDRLKLNEEIDKQRLYKLGGLQYKLLCHAMNAFPAAKRIVYSTCSIYPEENEEIILGALKHNGHFRLVDAKALFGKEWLNFGSSDYAGIGDHCLYARPETDLTIGMFVAVLERCDDYEYNEVYLAHEKQKESYEKLTKMGKAEFSRGKNNKRKQDQTTEIEILSECADGLPRSVEVSSVDVFSNQIKKKTKLSKREAQVVPEEQELIAEQTANENHVDGESDLKKKKKKQRENNVQDERKSKSMSPARDIAPGIEKQNYIEDAIELLSESIVGLDEHKKKKKKERQKKDYNKQEGKIQTINNDEKKQKLKVVLEEQESVTTTVEKINLGKPTEVLENMDIVNKHKRKKSRTAEKEELELTTVDTKPMELADNDVSTVAKKKKKKKHQC